MWWHKGKIVGRKVQGQNNEQNVQKRLLPLKTCHHSLPESWSAETSKEDEAKRLKSLFFSFCTCTSSLPLPFPRLCTALPQSLGICLLSVKVATPKDKMLFCSMCCKTRQWVFLCSGALPSLHTAHGREASMVFTSSFWVFRREVHWEELKKVLEGLCASQPVPYRTKPWSFCTDAVSISFVYFFCLVTALAAASVSENDCMQTSYCICS